MLSNLIITNQRVVLIIDKLGQEKISYKFITQLLKEQGQDDTTIKTFSLFKKRKEDETLNALINECQNNNNTKYNIILPPLSTLLCYLRPAIVFQFMHKLRTCKYVRRVFLWASIPCLPNARYILSACEYMADMVLSIESDDMLTIIVRKPGGGVTRNHYKYKLSVDKFLVEATQTTKRKPDKAITTPSENLGTFKIELDEEELVARNSIKMPYEKTVADTANIIYTPDSGDDFDEEDPDEDLSV
ncbi:elongator complex protein 5 [Teleopsis dalmanni]|uniref:elongator complex protein 5 n=1 Tax=Teleopsis dalmanni TaxID=139649 RepID=UPI0018CCC5F0|nr:elongator complex protein 5 [Teleopsis dalmanni]